MRMLFHTLLYSLLNTMLYTSNYNHIHSICQLSIFNLITIYFLFILHKNYFHPLFYILFLYTVEFTLRFHWLYQVLFSENLQQQATRFFHWRRRVLMPILHIFFLSQNLVLNCYASLFHWQLIAQQLHSCRELKQLQSLSALSLHLTVLPKLSVFMEYWPEWHYHVSFFPVHSQTQSACF